MRRCAERALAAAALAVLAACSPSSPATQVKETLARAAPLRIAAPGADADLERVRFSDVLVSMDGPRALVLAMAEADGRVRGEGGDAAIAYVGREAFAMQRCAGAAWCADGGPLPALRGVLAALPALEAGLRRDAGVQVRVVAWQVRVERERAAVGADYAAGAGQVEPRRLRARWDLIRGRDGWVLPAP